MPRSCENPFRKHVDCVCFFARGTVQTALLRFCFAVPLRGTGWRHSITILTPAGLPPAAAPGLTFVWLCVRSALHQGIRPTGRPDRLWCPPRKAISPAVHSSSRPFSTRQTSKSCVSATTATKVYSPHPCTRTTYRHICVHCRAPLIGCAHGGLGQGFTLSLMSIR
jgi:hypothetical protein